jgi:hypothetical protein
MQINHPTGIPACIRKLFGAMPIIAGESAGDYTDLMTIVRQEVEPRSVQEWLLLKDVVDAEWELLRLRGLKARMLHAAMPRAVMSELADDGGAPSPAAMVPLIRKHITGIVAGDQQAHRELDDLLRAQHLSLDVVTAAAFQRNIVPQQQADRMLGAAYDRRNAAFAELARLRPREDKSASAVRAAQAEHAADGDEHAAPAAANAGPARDGGEHPAPDATSARAAAQH